MPHLFGRCATEMLIAVPSLPPLVVAADLDGDALLQLCALILPLAVVEGTCGGYNGLTARGAPAGPSGTVKEQIKVVEAKVADDHVVVGLAPVTEGRKLDLSSSC